jgi:peptidoglycan hydrolase CwlO-like protein
MKYFKIALMAISVALLITSCFKKENEELKSRNTELSAYAAERDSLLNDMFGTYVQIEKNLSDITSREQMITGSAGSGEQLNDDIRVRIMDEIQQINSIMEENKTRIEELKKKLKNSDMKIKSLEETIRLLGKRLEEKDLEITSLKEQLVRLNFEIDSLNLTVAGLEEIKEEQTGIIEEQGAEIDEMNQVYYVIGTKKYLLENGILEKDGSFLSTKTGLSASAQGSLFTMADRRNLDYIGIGSEKAEFISAHPDGSYEWVVDGKVVKGLKILDNKKFWRTTNYLVIQTR